MLASLDEPPIAQRGLVYEPKYDGIRALIDLAPARKRGAAPTVAIYSRNGNEKTHQFPAVVAVLENLAKTLKAPLLLDGEIVAIDPRGTAAGIPSRSRAGSTSRQRRTSSAPNANSPRRSSSSTCFATPTKTSAVCRSPRAGFGSSNGSALRWEATAACV